MRFNPLTPLNSLKIFLKANGLFGQEVVRARITIPEKRPPQGCGSVQLLAMNANAYTADAMWTAHISCFTPRIDLRNIEQYSVKPE